MSKFPIKLSKDEAKTLPWEKMLLRHPKVKSYHGWESYLGLSQDTLRKPSSGQRGLSSKTYHLLMQDLIAHFSTGKEFRQWLYSTGWPQELIDRDRDYYGELYATINQAIKLPSVCLPPRYYVHRQVEEYQIYEVLTGEFSEARGIYISGSGGVGKTTLVAGTLLRYLPELHRQYHQIVWVDLFDGDGFETCVNQIVAGLGLETKLQTTRGMEDELQSYFSKNAVILVCNAIHAVPELRKLVHLVGYQGRLLITSRARLSLVQQKDYRLVHLELPPMDADQGKRLLEKMLDRAIAKDEESAVGRILQLTGCLPLALVLLASIASSPNMTLEGLANKLESHPLQTLAISGAPVSPGTSVRMSLDITYDYLLKHHPDAAKGFVALGIFTRPQSTIDILKQVLPYNDAEGETDRIISLLDFHHLLTLDEPDGAAVWRTHTLLHGLAKEYLQKDQPLREMLRHSLANATEAAITQYRDRFQHNQPVAKIIDYLKADIVEMSLGLLEDGHVMAALNMLESATSLLVDAGYFAEYQVWLDRLSVQVTAMDLPAGPTKCVVSNFVNLHNGEIHASLNDWEQARERWQDVKHCGEADPEYGQFVSAQIVKARSYELLLLARQGRNEAARKVLEKTQREISSLNIDLARQPEWQEALIDWFIAAGDLRSAHNAAQRALALFRDSHNVTKTVQIRKTVAEILVMEKNYAAAETAIRELIGEDVSSLSLRAELYIDLAYVLLQVQKPADALAQLDQAEKIFSSFPEGTSTESFAKLWSYRAWGSEQTGEMQQTLDQAHKSLFYWRKLPDSETSQQTLLDMISRVQKE
jgi:tetratricopeptide (TPR) repeat protein